MGRVSPRGRLSDVACLWARVNTILRNIKGSLHASYHSVSSKYLPRYLAEFCYRFNRRFSLREMFPRLAYVAF